MTVAAKERFRQTEEVLHLAAGACRVGVAKAKLPVKGSHPMAGYSLSGRRGTPGDDPLWARALYMEDPETRQPAILCIIDLMSASLRLVHEVHKLLGAESPLVGRIILCGTHTHSAPGRFYGNPFYDRLAQPLALFGYQAALTEGFANAIAKACKEAANNAQLGSLSVHSRLIWMGGNRSWKAYTSGCQDAEAPRPAAQPQPGMDDWQSAVDPRLTVLCARHEDQLVGAFAWYGCHATAMGRKTNTFHRDWPGIAVDLAENRLGGICAVGAGPLGDVSPLPSEIYRFPDTRRAARARAVAEHQGTELARTVGERIAQALVEVADQTPEPIQKALPITLSTGVFEVSPRWGAPRWQFGVPALGGAEDGGPSVPFYEFVREGFRSASGPQRPKAPALGFIQAQGLGLLDIAEHHPWYRLRLGEHVICTVPGEPTTIAAWVLEDAAQRDLQAQSASIIGLAGDYAGYFTSPAEYRSQHYEGASTLYGSQTLEWYRNSLMGLANPLPPLGSGLSHPPGAVPKRHLLNGQAHELPNPQPGRVSIFLGVAGNAQPQNVRLARADKVEHSGHIRHYPNPDPDGPSSVRTYTAEFDLSQGPVKSDELAQCRLRYDLNGSTHDCEIVLNDAAEQNGRFPSSAYRRPGQFGWIRRVFLLLTLLCALCGTAAVALCWKIPEWLGFPDGPFDRLMTCGVGLTFWLLAINYGYAKNSRDLGALSRYAYAGAAFGVVLALLFGFLGMRVWGIALPAASALPLVWVGAKIAGQQTGPHPSTYHWEFWAPLFWLGCLTFGVGSLLVVFPSLFVCWLGIDSPRGELWLRAYGGGFLVNTVAMWGCQKTRDLRIVQGQMWGSVFFDAGSLVLIALAVGFHLYNAWGLLLLLPFAAIVVSFPRIAARARRRETLEVERPRTTRELCRLVRDAARDRLQLRVLGSGHSVPGAIFTDRMPCPRPARPSSNPTVHVSLDHLDGIIDVDRRRCLITVQAGMRLGEDPGEPSSVHNNLLLHLKDLGWALGDLGGIVHQTVGGFLSTGSAGGSARHSFLESVFSIRLVDGKGNIQEVRNPAFLDNGNVNPAPIADSLFDAVSVGLGLLGVIVEVTFRCEPRYFVQGREFTASVAADTGTARFPSESWPSRQGPAPTQVQLLSSDADGLAAYLQRVDYCRILWWPQKKVSKMAIWEGFRSNDTPDIERPYLPDAGWKQWFAGKALRLLGWSYGMGMLRVVGRWIRRKSLPALVNAFLPTSPKLFNAGWDVNLPMDTHVDDALIPVEFTELWFPLENTADVMKVLLEMYQDEDTAGAFSVELYLARRSNSWLSPAYQRDCFRVDIFWFQRNAGDPVLDYFPQFYEKLAKYEFRPHWAKYLPLPGSARGLEYLRQAYPRWADFMAARHQADPHDVFLSQYWRRHLGQ